MNPSIYTDGTYLTNNPTWHIEKSAWKAKQVVRILSANRILPKTICEVGCGAGEILASLQADPYIGSDCSLWGYEISPQAFDICKTKANAKLHFEFGDILGLPDVMYDLVLVMDVIEHVEDCFTFLRRIQAKGRYKLFHIPLDLSAQSILRDWPIADTYRKGGHVHFFTKRLALAILQDLGYDLLDHIYTSWSTDLAASSMRRQLAKLPRRSLFTINQDLAVRVFGGYSLLALAQ